MDGITLHSATVDGKRIAYCSKTVFEVQVGYKKGKYKTRYTFEGDIAKACQYYRCLNIGNGYKKRLWCGTLNNTTIAKYLS